MKQTITRKLEFDAAHRLINHEGKCRYLHGHRYTVYLTFSFEELDGVGRAIDFGVVKEVVGGWIDQYWDHNSIFNGDDPLRVAAAEYCKPIGPSGQPQAYLLWDSKTETGFNPTVENLVKELTKVVNTLLYSRKDYDGVPLHKKVSLAGIRMDETPNCYGEMKGEA